MACETFTILTLEVFVFFILMLWATPRLALFPQHRWGFNILGQLSEDDIIDPETGKSLGKLEIVKGTGRIIHLQDTMATIESDQYKRVKPRRIVKTSSPNRFGLIFEPQQTIEEFNPDSKTLIEFDSPEVGDYAKQIP